MTKMDSMDISLSNQENVSSMSIIEMKDLEALSSCADSAGGHLKVSLKRELFINLVHSRKREKKSQSFATLRRS